MFKVAGTHTNRGFKIEFGTPKGASSLNEVIENSDLSTSGPEYRAAFSLYSVINSLIEQGNAFQEGHSVYLSYAYVSNCRSGQGSNLLSYAELDILGVPKYNKIRIKASSINTPQHDNFRIDLDIKDHQHSTIKLSPVQGDIFTDESGHQYFLMPQVADLLRAHDALNSARATDVFKRDPYYRVKIYAEIRQHLVNCQASLDPYIKSEQIEIVDELDYRIRVSETGEATAEPLLPDAMSNFDESVIGVSKGKGQLGQGVQFKKDGKRVRVLFSGDAQETWKKLRAINAQPSEKRRQILKDPETYFDGKAPKEVIGDLFSERVEGFFIGPSQKIRSNSNSNESWSDGFEGQSGLIRSTSGGLTEFSYHPVPDFYEELKRKYSEAIESHRLRLQEVANETGAQHTEIPLQEEPIYIESFNDSFAPQELEMFLKRVEQINRIEVFEDQVELANQLISQAEINGMNTVNWPSGDGSSKTLPLESLKSSIPVQTISSDKNSVGLRVSDGRLAMTMEKQALLGTPPSWHFAEIDLRGFANPPFFKKEIALRPHQLQAYAWLRWVLELDNSKLSPKIKGALLADDMGLGKTVQIISLLSHMKSHEEFGKLPMLIVAPVSLLNTSWKTDGFYKFLDGSESYRLPFEVCQLNEAGSSINRSLLVAEATRVNLEIEGGKPFHECDIDIRIKEHLSRLKQWAQEKVILCSYETLRSRSIELGSIDFSLVVFDEAQKIKNTGVLQTDAARAIRAQMKVAMTGTPIENSLMDLWSIMECVAPDFLGTATEFREKYVKPIKLAPIGSPDRERLRKQLEQDLEPIWLRRTKQELYKSSSELKPITHFDSIEDEKGEVRNLHQVQMPESQYDVYRQQVGVFNSSKAGYRLAAIRNMLDACSAPWLATGIQPEWKRARDLFDICPKLEITFKILEEIRTKSEKVIIFANIIDLQKHLAFLILQWHRATSGKSLDCEVFNGEKPDRERQRIIDRFKNASGFKVLIISPKSGGAGLNLTEANHVIHYTREWNPALERQATDRVYRIGQTKPVFVYYPTSSLSDRSLESAEEHLANVLRSKREIIDDFTASQEEFAITEDAFKTMSANREDPRLTLVSVRAISWSDFQRLAALYFRSLGFQVEVVGRSRDRGCDLVCIGATRNVLVQVKHTSKWSLIGTPPINEIRGAHSHYEYKYGRKFELAAFTNGNFSPDAVNLAINGLEVELLEEHHLKRFLEVTDVRLSKVAG